ncbi:alpha/beta hydrolase family protein [Pseudonocardia sp. MH-G8]|uniref:alpha/beta hydrolase n=1 Tax=Pseudonocardia sp. MH-G8 TaxID=1854588 RepID=UPI0026DA4343|nr:alpha/beta hydrolase-fold protein [Pseudonocardia sp. MH-G8]
MSKFRPTRRGVLKTVATAVAVLAVSAGGLVTTAPPAGAVEGAAGLEVVKRDEHDPRMKFYEFSTPEIGGFNPRVNVLLPDGYDPGHSYPVLYLLHGGGPGQDFMAFDDYGIRQGTVGMDVIVVMPDGGMAGWYTDAKTSNAGKRNWETFHIDQLIPWVDANFSTIGNAEGRAVSGFSMGGFGALKYMAAHPDLFDSVSSHSGPADLRHDFGVVGHWANASSAVVELMGGTAFGVPWDEGKVSKENPAEHIDSFRGKRIFLSAGAGPFKDTDPSRLIADVNEIEVLPNQRAFRAQLDKAGIPHEGREHGAGHTVDKQNFIDDLHGIVAHLSGNAS